MNIEGAIARKAELAAEIRRIVEKFTAETGLRIESIYVESMDVTAYGDLAANRRSTVYGAVDVQVVLP